MSKIAITGTSRGLGLEMVRQASARGDKVLACFRSPKNAELFFNMDGVTPTLLDVTDPKACEDVARIFGPLDLLICNAGQYIGYGKLEDPAYTPEAWAQVLATNVSGVFFTARAFIPYLQPKHGKIAIISSRLGSNTESSSGGSYIYRASKAAVTNLATNLSLDLADKGIAVGAYHPGWVKTDMGGAEADIDSTESVAGLLARFDCLSMENTGRFEDYSGMRLAY
ncbi:SDR family oxidoreductase [Flexibacterium corallicola]|uniref:SDR family oxidoreductase n=1 Tax=Flexibacterium corallicola TaxID=3037259 RepID=UPI00286F4522|nr:SDR family oxidoreductase [Pseudovibrio sp. M1P-2-3]